MTGTLTGVGSSLAYGRHPRQALPDQPPQSLQQWEQWWLAVTRRAIAATYLIPHGRHGPAGQDQTRLVHASCVRGLQARQRTGTAQ